MNDSPATAHTLDRLTRRSFHRSCVAALAVAALRPLAWSQAPGSQASGSRAWETRVVLLLSGVVNDGGWGELAFAGLKKLSAEPGFRTAYAEEISLAQIQQVARGYSDDGFDLILGHGFEFSSALLDIAPDYPSQHYFVTSFRPQGKVPGNIMFVNMGYFDAAYAAGALAALISDRKQAVGFVGGEDDPTQNKIKKAFIAGAQHTVSGIKGLGIITGDYDNAAKGREAASTLIGNGADVIWHAADVTGLGAIQGAAAAKVKILGCYSDQTSLAPDHMATSFQMNLDGMVTTVAGAVANHTFAGGTEWRPTVDKMWLLKAGTNGDHNPHLISAAAWNGFQKIWSDLAARKIDVGSIVAAS
jgi:basic membrane protein A and related proteins